MQQEMGGEDPMTDLFFGCPIPDGDTYKQSIPLKDVWDHGKGREFGIHNLEETRIE